MRISTIASAASQGLLRRQKIQIDPAGNDRVSTIETGINPKGTKAMATTLALGFIAACAWGIHDFLIRYVTSRISVCSPCFWCCFSGLWRRPFGFCSALMRVCFPWRHRGPHQRTAGRGLGFSHGNRSCLSGGRVWALSGDAARSGWPGCAACRKFSGFFPSVWRLSMAQRCCSGRCSRWLVS